MSSNPSNTALSKIINDDFYPSLNGFRGIAIIMVVAFHFHMGLNGSLGVAIFFVLSGFLITTLCIKEINTRGKLSLRNFYIRRSLRIFPVAYLYILTILILNFVANLNIPWFQFAASSLYVMNFSYFRAHGFTWMLAQFWSLSVEEQFYLLFPFILKKNKQLFIYTIVFIVFILPLLCTLQEIFSSLNKGIFYAFTHYFIKFQAIAMGCLFSILTFNKVFDNVYILKTKVIGNIIACILIFYLQYNSFYSIRAVYTNGIICLLIGYLIISNLIPSNDIIYKVLNFKPLTFIGVLSYSIYIWQQLFVSNDPRLPNYLVNYPYNIGWIIIVSCISYFFYEKYFLRLKQKFKVV